MKVAEILRIKGSFVKTVPPHETALLASGHLRAEQIGALVVSTDGNSIDLFGRATPSWGRPSFWGAVTPSPPVPLLR
jgi:hypothetical protein